MSSRSTVTIHIPFEDMILINEMVSRGIYPNKSALIRDAVHKLIKNMKDMIIEKELDIHG